MLQAELTLTFQAANLQLPGAAVCWCWCYGHWACRLWGCWATCTGARLVPIVIFGKLSIILYVCQWTPWRVKQNSIHSNLSTLVSGGEITSTFDSPEHVKLGQCDLIEEIMIGEDKLLKFSGKWTLSFLLVSFFSTVNHMMCYHMVRALWKDFYSSGWSSNISTTSHQLCILL